MAESKQILNRRVSVRGTNTVDPVIGEGGGDSELSGYVRVISTNPDSTGTFDIDMTPYVTDDVLVYLSVPGGSKVGNVVMQVNSQTFAFLSSGIDGFQNTIGARIEKRGGRVFGMASVLHPKGAYQTFDGDVKALPVAIYGVSATQITNIRFSPETVAAPFPSNATINIYIRSKTPVTPV